MGFEFFLNGRCCDGKLDLFFFVDGCAWCIQRSGTLCVLFVRSPGPVKRSSINSFMLPVE